MFVCCFQGRASSTPQSPATISRYPLQVAINPDRHAHHKLDLFFTLGPLPHDGLALLLK
jgi:hypothetical protein